MARPAFQGSAVFSACGLHRLRLDRWWSDEPRALVLGCNPSKAGAELPDPTVWSVFGLLHGRPGIGGFTMVNVESFIATEPAAMARWRDGLELDALRAARAPNLALIRELSPAAAVRIVAFGNLVAVGPHTRRVLAALSLDNAYALWAFGLTEGGAPKHPLARGKHRIPAGQPLVAWQNFGGSLP